MKAIIIRNSQFGTLDGIITLNSVLRTLIFKHLKSGTATLLIDTEETLMYDIQS